MNKIKIANFLFHVFSVYPVGHVREKNRIFTTKTQSKLKLKLCNNKLFYPQGLYLVLQKGNECTMLFLSSFSKFLMSKLQFQASNVIFGSIIILYD